MTAKRYVYAITTRVTCTSDKRKAIKQQLMSDILGAMENGESLEAIMERMGSAKDVAKEFNANLSAEEQKAYLKSRKIKRVVSFMVVLTAVCALVYWAIPKSAPIGSSGVFTQEAVEEKTVQVIELLNQDDFESLKNDATEAMKNAIDTDAIAGVREQIGTDWGEYRSVGTIYTAEMKRRGERLAVAQTVAAYENISVTYTISFDKDMKLAGLYMK